ncbi:MAG: EcsC family protein [Erysipelotrichaceae bacterium]|nr:EcsC family protein [Erysipelotrichaceae bacterium]
MKDISKLFDKEKLKEAVSKVDLKEVTNKIADTATKVGETAQNVASNTVEKIKEIEKPQISEEDMMELLDKSYEGAINGIPGTKNCYEVAQEYLDKYGDPKVAADKFIDWQVAKCATSGFATSLGGILTLPVAIPANLASVIYIQMRMIGTLAILGGYDLKDDEVQTLVYICLVKSSVSDICKQTGVKIANKVTLSMLKKLPGTVLTKINQKVGTRLLTKFGEKGLINLSKVVPVVGGIVGGSVDYVDTKGIASHAYKVFLMNEIE